MPLLLDPAISRDYDLALCTGFYFFYKESLFMAGKMNEIVDSWKARLKEKPSFLQSLLSFRGMAILMVVEAHVMAVTFIIEVIMEAESTLIVGTGLWQIASF